MRSCPNCGEQNGDKAKFCQSCGTPLPQLEAGEERRKIVSLVFCDLTGSTALGESLDPETLRNIIKRYFDEMRTVLTRHGGTVEKFIGDAVMAAFGVPVIHEDDALRAVRAAHEMQLTMRRMNVDLEARYGKKLMARIGVNTGEVVAGDPSQGHGFVSGDAVNVAARLEQAAPPGEVLIGEPTYRIVRNVVNVEEVEPLELKGKSERVPAYRLVDVIDVGDHADRALASRFVGRAKEMQLVVNAFEQTLEERACHMVTVFGSAGAGKSRLAEEFIKTIEGKAQVLVGRCLPYGDGITFWPIAEAIRDFCSIHPEDDPAASVAKLRAAVGDPEDAELIVQRLTALLGLSADTPTSQDTFWAVRRLLELTAVQGPPVLVLEDIHWAEPTMLDLIEYVSGFVQTIPLMIICLARRELLEARSAWGRQSRSRTILLDPLPTPDVNDLITGLLDGARIPEQIRQQIVTAAEGNPLYVEEILKMLIDDGLLVRKEGRWIPTRTDMHELDIPPTIHALLSARLDRLPGDQQAVIQRGSVIGREFWWGAVTHLSTEELRDRIAGFLQDLVRKEVILPTTSVFTGEDAFQFSNLLTRDAAYRAIQKETRAELHERFAEWLESKTQGRGLEYGEILGYHLEQAYRLRDQLALWDDHTDELRKRAGALLKEAGLRAFARSDMPAAAKLLSRALSLLDAGDQQRLEVVDALFDAHIELGDLDTARKVAEDAGAAARTANSELASARADLHLIVVQDLTGDVPAEEEHVQGLLARFESLGDHFGLCRTHMLAAEFPYDANDGAATQKELQQALEHARAAGHALDEAKILSWLMTVSFFGPTHVDEALDICRQVLEVGANSSLLKAKCLNMMGGLEAMRGDFIAARDSVTESRKIQAEFGQELSLAHGTQIGGWVGFFADDPAAAEADLRLGYEILDRMGERPFLGTQAALLARALFMQDRVEEALEMTQVSEECDDDPVMKVEWGPTRARILALKGELDAAEILASEAAQIAVQGDSAIYTGNTLMALAEVELRFGRVDAAMGLIKRTLRLYEDKGVVPWIERTRMLLERVAAAT